MLRTVSAVLGCAALIAGAAAIPRVVGGAAIAIARPSFSPVAERSRSPMAIMPKRNPFAGDPSDAARSILDTTHPFGLPNGAAPQGAIARVSADTAPGDDQRVTAVVTGAHPFAIVEDARGSRLITLNDMLDGRAVVAIDAHGIRFSRGPDLSLQASAPNRIPPPSSAPFARPQGRLP